jgi:putative spermidine/putrescine transport system permease protein
MSTLTKKRYGLLPGETGKFAGILSGFILLLAVLPILTMIVMSFSGASNLDFPPSSYSLQWYKAAWNTFVSPDSSDVLSLGKAMTTSLMVACLTMIFATIIAVPAAYALTRCEFRGKAVALQLMSLPLVFPMVVLGLALLLVFDSLPFQITTSRLVIAHVILALPFVVKNCTAAMLSIGSEVEEAAQMLGASPTRAIVDVVVPLMKSGILAGMLLAFIVSFNEFTVTYFLYTIDVMTVPIWMYSRTVSSLDPTTLAIATLIIALDVTLIAWVDKIVAGKGRLF